jgi:hypothetical protein
MENLQNLDIKTRGSASPLQASAVPGFIPSSKNNNLDKFRVRYKKIDMNEPVDVAELEKIETKAIHNEGCYVLSKKEFVFMDKILILVQYLEEIKE